MPRTKRTAATAAAASIDATDQGPNGDESLPASDAATASPPVKRTRRSTAGSAAAGAKKASAAEKAAFAQPDPVDDEVPVPTEELVGEYVNVLDLCTSSYPDVTYHVYEDYAFPDDDEPPDHLRDELEGWEEYPELNASAQDMADTAFTPGVDDTFCPQTKTPTLAQYKAAVHNGVIPPPSTADVLLYEDMVYAPTHFPLPAAVSAWVDPADKRYKGFKRATVIELTACHAQATLTVVRPKIKMDTESGRYHYDYPPNVESAPHGERVPLMETVVYALDPVLDDLSPANIKPTEFKHLEQVDPYQTFCKQVTHSKSFERTTRNTGYVVQVPAKSRTVGVRTVWTIPPTSRIPGGPTQFTLPDDDPSVFRDAIRSTMMPYIRIVLRPVRGCNYEQPGNGTDKKPKTFGYVWSLYLRTDKIQSAMQSTSGTTSYAAKTAIRQLLAAVGTARGWVFSHAPQAPGTSSPDSVMLPSLPKPTDSVPDVSPVHFSSTQHASLFMWMYQRERRAPESNNFNLVLSETDVRHPLVKVADQLYYAPLSGLFSSSPETSLILAEPVPPVPITCADMLVKCVETHPAKYTGILALIKANPLMRPFPLPRSDVNLFPTRATLIVCTQIKVAHWAACAERVFGDSAVVLDRKSDLLASTWEQVCQADVVIVSDKFMFGAYDKVLGEVAAVREGETIKDAQARINTQRSHADRYAWADAPTRSACGGSYLASQRASLRNAAALDARDYDQGGNYLGGRGGPPVGRQNPMELLLNLLRARDMDRARFGGGRRRRFDPWGEFSDDEDDYYGDFGSGGYWSDEDDYGFGGRRRGYYDSDEDSDDGYGRDPYDYDPEQEYYDLVERPAKEAEEAERLAVKRAEAEKAAAAAAAPAAAKRRARPRPKGRPGAEATRAVPEVAPVMTNRTTLIDPPVHVSLNEVISTISARGAFESTDVPVLLHALHWHRIVFDGVTRATTFAAVLGADKIVNTNNKDFAPLRELHATSAITFTGLCKADWVTLESSSVDSLPAYRALALRQGDEPPRDLPVRAREELLRQIGVHVPAVDPDEIHALGPNVQVKTITVYPSHHEHVRAVALTGLLTDSLEASVRLVQDHHAWFNPDMRRATCSDSYRDGRLFDALSVRLWKRGDAYVWIKFSNLLAYAQLRGWALEDVIQDVIDPSRIAARPPEDVSMNPQLLTDGDWMSTGPHLGKLHYSFNKPEYAQMYTAIVKEVRAELSISPSHASNKLLSALRTQVREAALAASQLEHDTRDAFRRAKTRVPEVDRSSNGLAAITWFTKRGFTLDEITNKLELRIPTTEAAQQAFASVGHHEVLASYAGNRHTPYNVKQTTKDNLFKEAYGSIANPALLWVKSVACVDMVNIAVQVLDQKLDELLTVQAPSTSVHDSSSQVVPKYGCTNCPRVFLEPAADVVHWFPCGRRGCSSCRPHHTEKCKKCLESAKVPPVRLFYGIHVAARGAIEAEFERTLRENAMLTVVQDKCASFQIAETETNAGPLMENQTDQAAAIRDQRHHSEPSAFVRIFGSKIQAVVLYILEQLDAYPRAKFVAFSEYDNQQHLLLLALAFVGIKVQPVVNDSSASTYPPVASFKSDCDVRVLIVPFSKCDPGMNLVEATHVLLLHPYAGTTEPIVVVEEYGPWRELNQRQFSGSSAIQVVATKVQADKELKQRKEWKQKELGCLKTVINSGNESEVVHVARFVLSHTREEDFDGVKPSEIA